jgi:hypothetical protein
MEALHAVVPPHNCPKVDEVLQAQLWNCRCHFVSGTSATLSIDPCDFAC